MSDDEDCGFRINKEYADRYNRWREKEELQKLKDKYGDDANLEQDSESSSSEDEDAEGLTPKVEKDWLRTLSALKSKDPRIYDKNAKFYESSDSEESAKDGEKTRKTDAKRTPMYLKDYQRKIILDKQGHLSDEDDDDDAMPPGPSYFEEQQEIKKSIKEAIGKDSDSDDDEDLLTERIKSKEDQEKEESDYLEWLKGQKDSLSEKDEASKQLQSLKKYWTNPELDAGEKFLRDFILNKSYLDENEGKIPTYEELTKDDDDDDFSEEEKQLEREELFEQKYNFRFEDPDPDFIKSYPRTVGESVRRQDKSRATKRQEVKQRKEQEKAKKREEIKQLKKLKKKEILGKLDKIKKVTGNDQIGISDLDIEGDFDPEQHDKLMQQVFSEEYYDQEEDDIKPEFSDEEDLGLPATHWDDERGYYEGEEDLYADDPDFIMDADYDPSQQPSTSKKLSKKEKKKLKKQKKKGNQELEETVEDVSASVTSDKAALDKALDEYYKLDYEDIIEDQPCRFKYREVVPNDFGLTDEEILFCPDRELNAWASLKKVSQYRTREEELWDLRMYKKKSRNDKKKLNVLQSLRAENEAKDEDEDDEKEDDSDIQIPKLEGKSAKQKNKSTKLQNGAEKVDKMSVPVTSVDDNDEACIAEPSRTSLETMGDSTKSTNVEVTGKKRKKKKKVPSTDASSEPLTKKARREESDASQEAVVTNDNKESVVTTSQNKKKKKKKKKLKVSDERLKAYGFNPTKLKYTYFQKQKHKT